MQELEKILEEIDVKIAGSMGKKREGLLEAEEIIRKHTDVPTNDGWISVDDRITPTGAVFSRDFEPRIRMTDAQIEREVYEQ